MAAPRSTRISVLPKVCQASAPALGGSLTPVMVMVNVTASLVSSPPFAVPPLSESETVTVAVPNWFGAVVNVSRPVASMDGCTANRPLLLLETLKVSVCPASPGPASMPVAHDAE
jgi:hypothetical protein